MLSERQARQRNGGFVYSFKLLSYSYVSLQALLAITKAGESHDSAPSLHKENPQPRNGVENVLPVY